MELSWVIGGYIQIFGAIGIGRVVGEHTRRFLYSDTYYALMAREL